MKNVLFTPVLFMLSFNLLAQTPKVNQFIDSIAAKNNFNGTILISKNSTISYKKSFGFANFQFKVPNTVDTRYKVASITKAFTSVLILQLYEQGKIDLNKTISTYLPDYKGEAANKVKVVQL